MAGGNRAGAPAAPGKPPIRAWEEDAGRPRNQVARSHTIAPSSPHKTTVGSTIDTSMSPPPIVLATAVPRPNAATKLKNAAQSTASPGDNTRVETTVAMELAASWKPLMKSKVSATTTIASTSQTVADISRV